MSRYTGTFGDEAVHGAARFAIEDGICVGRITIVGAMAGWMNGPPQKDAASIAIIGLDHGGGLSRAALVTPLGAFQLRADEASAGYSVEFGGARSLSIRFE